MVNPVLRIGLAIVVLFAVAIIGSRTASSTPDGPTVSVQAAPSVVVAPNVVPDPAAFNFDEVMNNVVPMACTVPPTGTNCELVCKKDHYCTGFCNQRGGCTCIGRPPCP